MAEPMVIHTDLELFLTTWYRAELAAWPDAIAHDVEVTNHEPSDDAPFPKKLLVIREDGGADDWFLTGERDVGLSILAGSKENPKDAKDLARIVHALRTRIPAVADGNPVTAVRASNGPYAVPESQPRARQYITLTLGVVAAGV